MDKETFNRVWGLDVSRGFHSFILREDVGSRVFLFGQRKESASVPYILLRSVLRWSIRRRKAGLRYPDRIRGAAYLLNLSVFALIAAFFGMRFFHRNFPGIIRRRRSSGEE